MIKVIKDERINWFVNFIIPSESLFELDPVIAGGSMLAAYRAVKLHNTTEKWEELKRSLTRNPSQAKIDKFGDIDIWFNKANPIHNDKHAFNWLISDATNPGCFVDQLGDHSTYGMASKQSQWDHLPLQGNKLGLFKASKVSRWANTFFCNTTNAAKPLTREVQFIKKSFSSTEELLESFDFINCSVAWHNGKLYYDDRIDDSFGSFELRLNSVEAYEKGSVAMKIFNAIRAFKYSDRYNLDFSPTLTKYIFKLYFESKNIDYEAYKNHVLVIEEHYGTTISSVEALQGMVKRFHMMFNKFSKMKFFKKEYALYLVDCADKLPGLKELIQAKDSSTSQNIVSCPF